MSDLTTLANVKAYLGLTVADDDALVTRLITSLSDDFRRQVGRDLYPVASYTETRNGNGGTRLVLPQYPVVSVTSVSISGTTIPAVASYGDAGWSLDVDSVVLTGYCFLPGIQNVVIAYTAGYATVPTDVEQAVIELVAWRYREKDRQGQASKTLGGETISFSPYAQPPSVRDTVQRYVRLG